MSPLPQADRLRGLRVLIGNTPLLAIECDVGDGELRRVYAKAEHSNMTGSIKDRMAYHIIRRALGHPVTIFCDSNKKYLSTVLLREEPVKPGHRAPSVKLHSFRAINRVCDVCYDPGDPSTAPAGVYQLAKRIERRAASDRRQ